MKRMTDVLLNPAGGSEIVMGNTAIVRAMIESGVRVVTSYPGSPTPEIASAIQTLPAERCPLYFEFSTNEKVATEVAFGAALNGHLACVFFKSVGLNVAADTFVQLGLMNLPGGLVIVLGDDPGANSSQNEQDNRHLARLAYLPVLEPASPTEVYTMFKAAAALARAERTAVIVRLTTHVCHGKEKVTFAPWEPAPPDDTPRFSPQNGPYIPITSLVFPLKRQALERLGRLPGRLDPHICTKLSNHGNRRRGIITAGLPYLSLLDVLPAAREWPDILKLGLVHPLPRQKVLEFLQTHDEVKILEELDDFLEGQIKALAFDHRLPVRILGKLDPDDWMGEYTPDKVARVLARAWPDLLPPPPPPPTVTAPPRPAQLCPGCGHRSAFQAIRAALPPGTITVADIGCHTLGFLPPYEIGQVLLCMGHSCGTAAGLALFNRQRPVVAFLGDSTFFHAGLPGIINALFNHHDFTLIVMENGTTAMTGHQNHPGTGRNFREAVEAIPIRRVLEGLGVKTILETDTYQQDRLTALVKQALATPGFKTVIARHPCMLKFTREQARQGKPRLPPVRLTEACDQTKVCISSFACPSYQFTPEGKVRVHPDLCIGDGSCRPVCPRQAIQPGKKGEA
ncbi:MAG: Indolepyruvate oxidoreductase subunit IorA [Candidatus Ozemobacter sibiricus]|uniref:Indolepyruvate oxidoreductase subunit IorA n=1 Tax=Candidatus Ozemobacter sibiricus TaxID=2268124 RepID=A0A367ZJZ6_9BACT|nr:MAG: Indolepyruvate oxidoreductase subunit IorA [Candidatus Ozemobacter sibiricus]